jgi:hypothetical protein
MIKVYGCPLTERELNAMASYMDDATRESVHAEFAPCTPEKFIREYLDRDPEFIVLLKN